MMRQLIPLATSVVTLVGMWLAGNKDWRAWVVGLSSQSLWLTFIIMFEAWGLLPLCGALVIVYTRNLLRWFRERPTYNGPPVSREDIEAVMPGFTAQLIHEVYSPHPLFRHMEKDRPDTGSGSGPSPGG